MADINTSKLIPYLDAYQLHLKRENNGEDRLLANNQEDYKRRVAERAAETLDCRSWSEDIIGSGLIADHAIKAVQKNLNLIGRFQITAFSDKIKANLLISERLLYDLYHDLKEEECFERLCKLVGRKYDLLAYLYFILDPAKYLPLRPTIFDNIFRQLDINLKLTGRCSWDNYQEFLGTVANVRDVMKDYFKSDGIDLLDAHSFLWTVKSEELEVHNKADGSLNDASNEEKQSVYHREYGEGHIIKAQEEKIYIDFNGKVRIFSYPEAFDKEYLSVTKQPKQEHQ